MNWTEWSLQRIRVLRSGHPLIQGQVYTALRLLKNGRERHEMEHIFDNFTESTSTICKPYQNSSGENSYV